MSNRQRLRGRSTGPEPDLLSLLFACPECGETREPLNTMEIFDLLGDDGPAEYVLAIMEDEDCIVVGCWSCRGVGVIGSWS